MALDKCQSFVQNVVSAQYLENKMIEFNQILYAMILTRFGFELLHIIFRKFVTGMALD